MTTLINTRREIAIPIFLLCEYPEDFKETEILGKGGVSFVYKGDLFSQKLKSKNQIEHIAIKFIQGSFFKFFLQRK